jgi:hypothetical protein
MKLAALLVAGVAVLCVAVGFCTTSVENYRLLFGMYHDDSIYLTCAKALAEGDGYKIISLPGEPWQTKYPIGFPATLSVLWRANPQFPANVPIFEWFQVAIALLAVTVTCLYLVRTRKTTPLLGLVILSASVLNSHYIDFAPMIMSDLLCALVSVLALWLAEKTWEPQQSWLRRLPAGLSFLFLCFLSSAAVLIRSQGIVLILAILCYFLFRRRYVETAIFALFCTLFTAPWWMWQHAHQVTAGYLSYYTSYLAHTANTLPSLSEMWTLGSENAHWSGHLQVETYYPLVSALPFNILPATTFELVYRVGFLLLGLPLMFGLVRELRKRSLPGFYCLFYGIAMIFWPLKLEWRHIVTILPFGYFLMFQGWRWLGYWLKPRVKRWTPVLSIAFATYLCLGTLWQTVEHSGKTTRSWQSPILVANPRAVAYDVAEANSWIRHDTKPSDIFVSNNDPALFLATGRKAVPPSDYALTRFARARLVDESTLLEALRSNDVRYVMVEPTYRTNGILWKQSAQAAAGLASHRPELFERAFISKNGLVQILSVNRGELK